jgi:putative transposase
MRVEPYRVGSFLHVVKRGTRGMPIVRDDADYWRFAKLLYYLNDKQQGEFWEDSVKDLFLFERPSAWSERKSLVRILSWTLMPNHFHLLLEEIQEGGIAKFMQRLCGSMSRHCNEKYKEQGTMFQGSYRARTVNSDEYMRYVIPYIAVKNVFELYPGGFDEAARHFDDAWQWGIHSYLFSSLPEHGGIRTFPIIDQERFTTLFDSTEHFRSCAKDMILGRAGIISELSAFE